VSARADLTRLARLAPLALAALVGCPTEVDPCAELAPIPLGPLTTEGTTLRDADGRAVTLRGVNTGGRSKFAPYLPFDFDDDFDGALNTYLDRAATWGVDVLRVPFSWAALEPTEGTWDEVWLGRYVALLDGAHARGIWTIVDLHQDIYAEPFCGDGFPTWTIPGDPGPPQHDCPTWYLGYFDDPDVAAAFDRLWANEDGLRDKLDGMWEALVTRLASHPGVLGYELLNEPGWGTMDRDLFTSTVLPAWYEDLVPRLQAIDPDALYFLDTNGVEGPAASTVMPRPALDGIVFAPHFYHPTIILGPDGPAIEDDASTGLSGWAAVGDEWDVPVLIGEFGVPIGREGGADWIASHYDAFDALGLHGTIWEYSVSTDVWNEESLSIVYATGGETELVEPMARPYLKAVAGEVSELTVTSERLAATWSGEIDGISEIALPSRSWADATVTADGGCVAQVEGRTFVRATSEEVTLDVTR